MHINFTCMNPTHPSQTTLFSSWINVSFPTVSEKCIKKQNVRGCRTCVWQKTGCLLHGSLSEKSRWTKLRGSTRVTRSSAMELLVCHFPLALFANYFLEEERFGRPLLPRRCQVRKLISRGWSNKVGRRKLLRSIVLITRGNSFCFCILVIQLTLNSYNYWF